MEPETQQSTETVLLSWEIPSHDHQEHSFGFFAWIITVMVILLLFSVWQKNFLFGVFILMAAGTVLFLALQNPETHQFMLTSSHIIFGNYQRELSYAELSHFDIQEFSETDMEIFFAFKDKKRAPIHMRVYKGDREKIISILQEKGLKEKEIDISLFESISKMLGV
jgi:hypothetical protein